MMNTLMPGRAAPDLNVALTNGKHYRLKEQRPRKFSLVVFYRGKHCAVCRKYLKELSLLREQLLKAGVSPVAISMDTEERARQATAEWDLGELDVGFGLTEQDARDWGLFISEAIKDSEPARFSEPGLFLITPEHTLYYVALNSMPYGRPSLQEFAGSIEFIVSENYPPRGTAAR